jgi:hypothetical protein
MQNKKGSMRALILRPQPLPRHAAFPSSPQSTRRPSSEEMRAAFSSALQIRTDTVTRAANHSPHAASCPLRFAPSCSPMLLSSRLRSSVFPMLGKFSNFREQRYRASLRHVLDVNCKGSPGLRRTIANCVHCKRGAHCVSICGNTCT